MLPEHRNMLASLHNTPLAIRAETFAEVSRIVAIRIRNGQEFQAASRPGRGEESFMRAGDTALISIGGIITARPSILSEFFGGCSAEGIGRAIDAAATDRSIKAIVLAVDSPGGQVFGLQECAAKIAAAAQVKRTVAQVNPMCASAAVWLASQANEIAITPSGQMGSIGVLYAHVDDSKAQEMEGLKTTIIASGEHKSELWKPLTAEAIAALQNTSDEYYYSFVSAVARGRKTTQKNVRETYGKGRMLTAKSAVSVGMADRLGTLEETFRTVASGGSSRSASAISGAIEDSERARRNRIADLAEMGLPTTTPTPRY